MSNTIKTNANTLETPDSPRRHSLREKVGSVVLIGALSAVTAIGIAETTPHSSKKAIRHPVPTLPATPKPTSPAPTESTTTTPRPIATTPEGDLLSPFKNIHVVGNERFRNYTTAALDLLQGVPEALSLVQKYPAVIEELDEHSMVRADLNPPRIILSPLQLQSGPLLMAAGLAGEFKLIDLHEQYKQEHPGTKYVPFSAWGSHAAEVIGVKFNADVANKLGATEAQVGHILEQTTSGFDKVPNQQQR